MNVGGERTILSLTEPSFDGDMCLCAPQPGPPLLISEKLAVGITGAFAAEAWKGKDRFVYGRQ